MATHARDVTPETRAVPRDAAPAEYSPEYERDRDQAIAAALPRASYGRAFQPGCSAGELTGRLAPRCVQVVATNYIPAIVTRARQRCARYLNVEVLQASLAAAPPPGSFDLIVLGDFGSQFRPIPLVDTVLRMAGQLQLGGELVAAHSLVPRTAGLLYGDAVHFLLGSQLPLNLVYSERYDEFRVDVWKRL